MKPARILLGLALLGLAAGTATAADRHVVVISIDGLPAYLLNDPKADLPVLRGLIARGATATAGMVVSNPSVTWPNHTTLMSGAHPEVHGVLFNGLPERQGPGLPVKTDPAKTQAELVRVPLLFDVLKDAGKTSAAINWPCTRGSSSIADNFPDVPDALEHTTPRLKAELDEAGQLATFAKGGGPARDEVWTAAACRVLRERKPALLTLHLLNLDGVHHRFGPRTPQGYEAAALADARVGRVLAAIDEAGLRDSTAVIVVSDHGFRLATKSLRPNVLLRKAGLLTADDRGRITAAKAHVVPEGGVGLLYLTDPATATADAAAVRKALDGVEGVAAVLGPESFPGLRLPTPADYPPMADLIVACRPGYSIGGTAAGDAPVVDQDGALGVHGYLATDPEMRAVFIAAGAGIRPGVTIATADNADVAPTVAQLLGVTLPRATGQALKPILAAD